jgi:glycosyltransferase involved in cell wall biosynthesis
LGAGVIRVAVDLLWLRPGIVGGSEDVVVSQLAALADHAQADVAPHLYTLPAFAGAHPDLVARLPVEAAPVSGHWRAMRVAAESTWLFRRARRDRAQILHAPGGTLPLLRGAPVTVVTVHDLQYLAYPQFFSTVKLAWLRWAVPAAMKRACVVVTYSQYVRGTVEESFPALAGRVLVAPPALPPLSDRAEAPDLDEADLRARYRLPGPFIICPAITYPHKNHVVLLEALAALGSSHPDLALVLLGGQGSAEADLRAAIARLGLGGRVRRPGRVPEADRDGLYRLATALAFPSRFEGLGVPVLEALRLGCPVVAADATALPETVGGAGLLVPPREPDAWAAALADLVDDPSERALLAAAGYQRVAAFTPERAAAALVEAYRLALP